ncbi:hypothetical protein BJX61DRAFT_539614 [Aspergillus egyptiacus]|nr:hypothetical protein BJX61DRAFT_539614 [Aspergillus egyptiacus]
MKLLTSLLQKKKAKSPSRSVRFDMGALESPSPDLRKSMQNRLFILTQTANWANARDIQTLEKSIFGGALQAMRMKEISIGEDLILSTMDHMLSEQNVSYIKPSVGTVSNQATVQETKPEEEPAPLIHTTSMPRDDGVSDTTWEELQRDLQAAKRQEEAYKALLDDERAAQKVLEEVPDVPIDDSDPEDEAKRQHEQRRIQELERRAKLDELQKKREAEEKARLRERKVQQKLRKMGVCCMGYQWIKQASGYRCAGGSHYVSNEQLWV